MREKKKNIHNLSNLLLSIEFDPFYRNEEEISLINRKHSEEVEVYRIQLQNASKTISQLQAKR